MTIPNWITLAGPITSIMEDVSYVYALLFLATPPATVTLIAGSLPPGLTINNLGVISGTPLLEPTPTTYDFTIRLQNVDGLVDRSFSITIEDTIPVWSITTDLGTYLPNTPVDISLIVTDPGGTIKNFEKISGELPLNLKINNFGKIYGIIDNIVTLTIYTFTVRCVMNDTKILDRTFTITVNPLAIPGPVWITPAGVLGNILTNEPYSQTLLAIDPLGGLISYSSAGLPVGLTLDPISGTISGSLLLPATVVYAFSVIATAGLISVSRVFQLNANNSTTFPVTWTTPAGNVGSIKEGEKSLFGVRATTLGQWIRYELNSGALPVGLTIDPNSGDIWGIANEQVSNDTVFTFEIKAYNETSYALRTFTLTLLNNYSPSAARTYITVYGVDKLVWVDLFTTPEILYGNIFREGDNQYGLIEQPKILLTENLDNPLPDDIQHALAGVRRTYLNLGRVEVAQAKENGSVVYEVLYRRIFDDSAGAALGDFSNTVATTDINTGETLTTSLIPPSVVRPGSLTNIRTHLLTLGASGGTNMLPLWMQTSGWIPCIPFAHVKPSTGQAIADKINASDVQLKKLYQNRVRVDRLIVEPAANTLFEPYYILFDSNY